MCIVLTKCTAAARYACQCLFRYVHAVTAAGMLVQIWEDIRPKGADGAPAADAPPDGTAAAAAPASAPAETTTQGGAPDDSKEEPAAAADPADADKAAAPQGAQDFGTLIQDEVSDLKDKKQHAFRFYDTGIKTLLFLEMPFATKEAGPCQVHLTRSRDAQPLLPARSFAAQVPDQGCQQRGSACALGARVRAIWGSALTQR